MKHQENSLKVLPKSKEEKCISDERGFTQGQICFSSADFVIGRRQSREVWYQGRNLQLLCCTFPLACPRKCGMGDMACCQPASASEPGDESVLPTSQLGALISISLPEWALAHLRMPWQTVNFPWATSWFLIRPFIPRRLYLTVLR